VPQPPNPSPGYPAVPQLDHALGLASPTLSEYIDAASAYVLNGRNLPARRTAQSESAKAAQTALSGLLGRVLSDELAARHEAFIMNELGAGVLTGTAREQPHLMAPERGETRVAGGLRVAQSDVTELHRLDGVRLAIELKPVYRAVGRAIWNRYGDVRAFAVNVHLKFPFAVVGGVMVVPTLDVDDQGNHLDVRRYCERAARRLSRIRARTSEAEAGHLLEGFGLLIIDPLTSTLDAQIPDQSSPLHYDNFMDALVRSYDVRFGAERAA
jgi:hypothetical protein